MTTTARSWLAWFLPVLISAGMAVGAIIGLSIGSDMVTQEGPKGDMAGAAGALAAVLCILAGFVMSTLTIITAKLLRRGPPARFALRFVLSIAGGIVIGVLGPRTGVIAIAASWILLLGTPALLAWTWQTGDPGPELNKP